MNRDRMYDALLRRVLPVPPGWHHPRAEAQVVLRDDGRARVALQGLVAPSAPGLWIVEVRVGGQWVPLADDGGHRSFLTAAVRAEQAVPRDGELALSVDQHVLVDKIQVLGAELDETSGLLAEEQALHESYREHLRDATVEVSSLRRMVMVLEGLVAALAGRLGALERRHARRRPGDPSV